MSLIPTVTCRRCGYEYKATSRRCPNCGTRRVQQSGRTPAGTPSTVKGTAANGRASMNARWQMIFGVATHPAHQRKGYAGMLLATAVDDCKREGREGLVLTCKEHKLHYYAKFGFVNEGISSSEHGGAAWYQMRIRF